MINWCVWPCGTVCQQSELEEYLTFMSDDFVMCSTPDEDEGAVPDYDEIITAKRLWNVYAIFGEP